jgi:hypothetical protein
MRARPIDAWTKASTQMPAENGGCTQMGTRCECRAPSRRLSASGFASVSEYQAFHRRFGTEVQEETNLHIGGPKVIEKLFAVRFDESDGGFYLHDHPSFDEQVSTEVAHLNTVVPDVDWDLDLDSEPDLAQLVREGTSIDGFEKAKSKLVVHPKERPNDRARYFAFRIGICVHRGSYLRPSALPLLAR